MDPTGFNSGEEHNTAGKPLQEWCAMSRGPRPGCVIRDSVHHEQSQVTGDHEGDAEKSGQDVRGADDSVQGRSFGRLKRARRFIYQQSDRGHEADRGAHQRESIYPKQHRPSFARYPIARQQLLVHSAGIISPEMGYHIDVGEALHVTDGRRHFPAPVQSAA